MFEEVLLDNNVELYTSYYNCAHYKSIYNHPDYLLSEEEAENGKTYLYIYKEKENVVILPSIKRKINDIKGFHDLKEEYFDLITPHEYSGVIALEYSVEVISDFYVQLGLYCNEHNIIFSFIRFNPYTEEHKTAMGYHVFKSADQVWINCRNSNLEEGYSKSLKRDRRIAIREHLTCKVVEKSVENRKIFEELYKKAMDRLEASSFYYFSENYFEKLICTDFTSLFFVYDRTDKYILAAAVVVKDEYNKRAYYHLGCRNIQFHEIGTMELLKTQFSELLQSENYNCVHLGGGAKGLLKFKEKFSRDRVEYHVGYCIFNSKIYHMLSEKFQNLYPDKHNSVFYPIYRNGE